MINIIVVSEINRSLELIPINTFVSQNQTFTNNLISNLDYQNYVVKLSDINTNFSINAFQLIKDEMTNDITILIILIMMLVSVYIFLNYLRKL